MIERIAHYEGAGLKVPTDIIRADHAENTSLYYLQTGSGKAAHVAKEDPSLSVVRASAKVEKLIKERRREFPESPWDEATQPRFIFEVNRQEKDNPRELQVALLTHAVLMDVLFEGGLSGKNWVRRPSTENVGIIDDNDTIGSFYHDQLHLQKGASIPYLGRAGITLVRAYQANAEELLYDAGKVIGLRDIEMSRDLPGVGEREPYRAARAKRLVRLGVTEETLDSLY